MSEKSEQALETQPETNKGEWTPKAGWTVLGIISSLVVNSLVGGVFTLLPNTNSPEAVVAVILAIAFILVNIIYAAKIYLKFFNLSAEAKRRHNYSFWNGFFGGIVFGLIWNFSMKKNEKGIANSVFIILLLTCTIIASIWSSGLPEDYMALRDTVIAQQELIETQDQQLGALQRRISELEGDVDTQYATIQNMRVDIDSKAPIVRTDSNGVSYYAMYTHRGAGSYWWWWGE
jgi:hypothetical protein